MENTEWMDELSRLAQKDEWHLRCLSDVQSLEASYLRILDSLPEEQRQILDAYVTACEALDNEEARIAYRLGIEHGRKL